MNLIQMSCGSMSGSLGDIVSFILSSGASGDISSCRVSKRPSSAVWDPCQAKIISCRNFISMSGRADKSQFQHSTITYTKKYIIGE